MYMEFEINGEQFVITKHYEGGYQWTSGELRSDIFSTAAGAQQDALNNEQEHVEALEEEYNPYGSYEKQMDDLWKSTRL